jgi:threonine/homoserine/homoserine lactone efflux protein
VLVHIAAAAAGISAVLLASATAFGFVKTLGAGYLIYLGIRTLLTRPPMASVVATPQRSFHRLFTDGVLVSVFNPKIAVFFLAFLPQFVQPSRGPIPQQILLLGLIYVFLALVTDSGYALLASHLRHWLGGQVMRGPLPQYVSGSLYVGLGVSTALIGRRH